MSHNDSLFNDEPRTFKLASSEEASFSRGSQSSFSRGSKSSGASSDSAFKDGAASAASGGGLALIAEGITDITESGAKKVQAKNIEFAAQQELIKGTQVAANFLEELNNIQASNIVLSFAQGRQLTGSVVSIQQELGLKAARSVRTVKLDQNIKSLALERQARYLKSVAKWQKTVGPLKIIGGIVLTWATYGAGA